MNDNLTRIFRHYQLDNNNPYDIFDRYKNCRCIARKSPQNKVFVSSLFDKYDSGNVVSIMQSYGEKTDKTNILNYISRQKDSEPIRTAENPDTEIPALTEDENDYIFPDENYIKLALRYKSDIDSLLLSWDSRKYAEGLNKLIDEGADDAEDLICMFHNYVKKYIYGSLVKVSIENRVFLYDHLQKLGYKKVQVSEGDDLRENTEYFEAQYGIKPKNQEQNWQISTIHTFPYELCWKDENGSKEKLILQGSCSYYRM